VLTAYDLPIESLSIFLRQDRDARRDESGERGTSVP